jgi:hypothetical protein
MTQLHHPAFEIGRLESHISLDLVVPFTTPRSTEKALEAARVLGAGLNSAIRLVRVQVVPFPLDLRFSPVPQEFLEAQLSRLSGGAPDIPVTIEIRLAREFESGLLGTLRFRSMVVLASRKRPWRTRTERLAASLRLAGHTVILTPESDPNA